MVVITGALVGAVPQLRFNDQRRFEVHASAQPRVARGAYASRVDGGSAYSLTTARARSPDERPHHTYFHTSPFA